MKGKLNDGTPVDISKPGMIEQDGKWWEPGEYKNPNKGEYWYGISGGKIYGPCNRDEDYPNWIMSKIPRASASQLAAIGMRERDGRPVEVKRDDILWAGSYPIYHADKEYIGKFRFILEPVVKREVHTSCEGCWKFKPKTENCWNACYDYETRERKNYTPKQPPRPEELRFTTQEVKNYLVVHINMASSKESNKNLIDAVNDLFDEDNGIAAFTERRRG
jgi:hypothetical protein